MGVPDAPGRQAGGPRRSPVRFLSFANIGGLGVGVHMAVLSTLLAIGAANFVVAQVVATVFAMIFNFIINNTLGAVWNYATTATGDVRPRAWSLIHNNFRY